MWSTTRSSHRILPSSTSIASAAAVNAFVFDAIRNSDCGVTGSALAELADAVAFRQHDAPVLHHGDGDPGDLERLPRVLDDAVEIVLRGRDGGGSDQHATAS